MSPTSLNRFCMQLNEFCLIFQEEILQMESTPRKSPTIDQAVTFLESLMLCPTIEAARMCIRRDVTGARSFLVAADGVLKRLRTQQFQFSMEEPQFQTKFYLLSCAIGEFVKSQREEASGLAGPASAPPHAKVSPAL